MIQQLGHIGREIARRADAFGMRVAAVVPSERPTPPPPQAIAAFATYAFSWMRFPFRGTLFMVVVALLVVPLQMALIPVQEIYQTLGINQTFLGVWLAHAAFGLPLAIFLLYNFISQLPGDLFETASIDGSAVGEGATRE